MSTKARPPIRWNGGKTYRLPQIGALLAGRDWSGWHYVEAMAGGGALYWRFAHLFRTRAINDVIPELTNLYRVLRDDVGGLITTLRDSDRFWFRSRDDPASKNHFLALRTQYGKGTPLRRAATFLYLNKCSINGLHRLNRSGGFNAAPGDAVNPQIVDEPLLRACAASLAGTLVLTQDATAVVRTLARSRSQRVLMMVDPPYDAGYTGYAGGFSQADQARLVRAMLNSGARYIYTNSDTSYVRSLFAGAAGVSMTTLPLKHKVGPKEARGKTTGELLIHNL